MIFMPGMTTAMCVCVCVLAQINWSLLLHLFSRDMADSRIRQMAEMCLTFTELKIDVWMQHKASVAQNTPDLTLTASPAK